MSGIDVTGLEAYIQKYPSQLLYTLLTGFTAANDIMVMPNVKGSQVIGRMDPSKGLRPFSSDEEFGTKLTYSDRKLETDYGKYELKINLHDYKQTYLADMLAAGDSATKDPKQKIPFFQWTLQRIIESVQTEFDTQTVFHGFDKSDATAWLVGTSYTTGDFVTAMRDGVQYYFQAVQNSTGEDPATDTTETYWKDVTARAICPGIEYRLLEDITNSLISPLTTGAISTAQDAYDAMIELWRSTPDAYRTKKMMVLHVSHTDFDLLMDHLESITKNFREDVSEGKSLAYVYLPKTSKRVIVKPAVWLNESRRMILQPASPSNRFKGSNIWMGTELVSDMNEISMKAPELWRVKFGLKFAAGFQIANPDEIWVTDQS